VLPYLVAMATAALIAATEQATRLDRRARIPKSLKAIWWWSLRLSSEALVAALALMAVDGLGVTVRGGGEVADHVGGGVVIALATAAGLRSNLVELSEHAFGLHSKFGDWREYVTSRLRTLQALETSRVMVKEVLPAVGSGLLTPEQVGDRIRYFVTSNRNLPPRDRRNELEFINGTVADEATDAETRIRTLLDRALEYEGGQELVAEIRSDAEETSGSG
jgi:hypothetical protein